MSRTVPLVGLLIIGVVIGVAGCGASLLPSTAEPTAHDVRAPDIPVPPDAHINGIAGMPASYCWGGACVDGVFPPQLRDTAPAVRAPHGVVPPPGSHVESVTAADYDLADPFRAVSFEGLEIGSLPVGVDVLLVNVRWASGEDVTYAWRVLP
ncbi:MAG: hypothetical protein ABI622_09730 [Chloroflexota bacterium]